MNRDESYDRKGQISLEKCNSGHKFRSKLTVSPENSGLHAEGAGGSLGESR